MVQDMVLSPTDKKELRSKILAACIQQRKGVVSDIRKRIYSMMANDLTLGKEEYDFHQLTYNTEAMMEISMLRDELELAARELNCLMHIPNYADHDHEHVEYGSIVETDKEIFFVSIGTDRMYVDGISFVGLSANSPIYQAMKGKSQGDLFFHDDVGYLITEVF